MPQNNNVTVPNGLLVQLRRLTPKRPLTYGESLTVARVQAARLRQMLSVKTAAMPLRWLIGGLTEIEVQPVPAHTLDEGTSGMTTRKDGRYLLLINRNNSHAHRRFTLSHELKHVLDHPYVSLNYAELGQGDIDLQESRIETIANHFAAHLLMPAAQVKRAWMAGIQDVHALAGLFEVSREAMRIRLQSLGFTDEKRPAALYFRRVRLPRQAWEVLAF
jgi:Zn-dependent peptidase ImmA (M78 family)